MLFKGHKSYEKGTNGYFKIIETFGNDVLDDNEQINRRVLGKKVFEHQSMLKKLNEIVWPEILNILRTQINFLFENENKRIIIVEAALLIDAEWHKAMNEVWVCYLPVEEVK